MAYIGNSPENIQRGRRSVYEFKATAGQTAFSGADLNNQTLDLLEENEMGVYLNGIRLADSDDYSISGDTLTLLSAASLNDQLTVETQTEVANISSYTRTETDARYINYDGDIINGTLQIAGSGNNIELGDSNKVIFGAGSDLQIFHDGSNSFINEVGAGDLTIKASNNLYLMSGSSEIYAKFTADGASTLYHNNLPRLATTSSGIDVTNTVTADVFISANNNTDDTNKIATFLSRQYDSGTETEGFLVFQTFANSSGNRIDIGGATSAYNASTEITFNTAANTTTRTGTKRLDINSGGDISFYEDTGTTAKFFWDASAESLQIGGTANIQAQGSNVTTFGNNFVLDSGYKYLTSGAANMLYFDAAGNTMFFKASSGTAGNAVSFSETMRIDSSGNVGIGTTNPVAQFAVGGAGRRIEIQGTDSVIRAFDRTASWAEMQFEGASYTFDTSGSERMRIDSSGNLLVGRSNNLAGARTLVAGTKSGTNGTNGQLVVLDEQAYSTTDNGGGISFAGNFYNGGQVVFATVQGVKANNTDSNNAGALKFTTKANGANQVEAMRIDSSGNLLVGATTSNSANVGHGFNSDGFAYHTRDGGAMLRLNRLTSDGDIMQFQKDGAIRGSIGVQGARPYFGNNINFSIKCDDANNGSLVPANQSGVPNNNVSDIGLASNRWNDLYLGGGVYLGGTGAANKLDDYEEGTWTPAFESVTVSNYASQQGKYTKIGSLVNCTVSIDVSSGLDTSDGSGVKINLPFTAIANEEAAVVSLGRYINILGSKATSVNNYRLASSSLLLYQAHDSSITYNTINSGGFLQMAFTYRTSA